MTDWYLHPEHETVNRVTNGAVTVPLSLFAIVGSAASMVLSRRRRGVAEPADQAPPAPRFGRTPMYSRSPLFVPPGTRPLQAQWQASLLLLAVVVSDWLAVVVGTRLA